MLAPKIFKENKTVYDFTSCPRHAHHVGSKPWGEVPEKLQVYKGYSSKQVEAYTNTGDKLRTRCKRHEEFGR